jgi:hypothetical protein
MVFIDFEKTNCESFFRSIAGNYRIDILDSTVCICNSKLEKYIYIVNESTCDRHIKVKLEMQVDPLEISDSSRYSKDNNIYPIPNRI